ncbi:SDR family oxidoreductase [Streptomyces sp. NPDC048045]|uniref:SDR family oxidoreductase n=1 Tax=Streptomyces sp. NPDC048045 TaxID=3154710 RepID=UPI003443966A
MSRGRRVACLVRSGDPRRSDVIQRLDGLGLWQDHYAGQLEIVAGDLAEPSLLRIDRPVYDELALRAGAIVHCAAWVNHVFPYDVLAEANAHSAAAILELAVTKHRKPVTFVSSGGVFEPSHYPVGTEIAAGPLTGFPPECDGYGRSKAVAEAHFARAAEGGASVSVVRIPSIFGDRDARAASRTATPSGAGPRPFS